MRSIAFVALAGALAAPPARADVSLQLFADVGVNVVHDTARTRPSFSSNHLDFFGSAGRERLSFLSEVVFEVNENNEFTPEMERLQVSYLVASWLRLSAGRFHTAIGYYNDAFHHGAVFQLPIERPLPVRFEDSGGVIPAHFVGLHADGRIPLGGFALRYDLETANNRAPTRDGVVNAFDALDGKAVNGRLRLEAPVGDATLVVGGNLLFDRIPANSAHGELGERILGLHAAFQDRGLLFAAEGYLLRHEAPTGAAFDTRAGFVELGVRVYEEVVPFALVDFVDYPDGGDPYFAGERSNVTVNGGVRWLFAESTALKAQAGRRLGDITATRFALQLAVGF